MTNYAGRQSKNERRDAAREKARRQREAQQRRERRNRVLLQGGITVVVLAIVVVVAVVVVNVVRPPGAGPKNMADDGVVISGASLAAETTGALAAGATPVQRTAQSGKIAIRTYEDFGCPICGEFEQTNAAYIKQLVQSGRATLQIYPVAILDRNFEGSKYSTRAANAAAAVANYSPNRFFAFHALMYQKQPKELTTGLTDDQIIAIAKQAKVTDLAEITAAIRSGKYENWVADATQRFTEYKYQDTNVTSLADLQKYLGSSATGAGTPTIFIDGKIYTGSVSDQSAFSSAIAATDQYTSTPTPTPTPTSSK